MTFMPGAREIPDPEAEVQRLADHRAGLNAGPEDERGTWTITLEGGPALAANLAVTVRGLTAQSWPGRIPATARLMERLTAALDQAQFTPVRTMAEGAGE